MTVGIPRQPSNPESNMPRLRPISLAKLKAGDRDEAARVVRDLCLLTPRGAAQNLKPSAYQKVDSWRGKNAYLNSAMATDSNYRYAPESWGYTDEHFYYTALALGHQGAWFSEHHARSLVYNSFDECTDHKATRSGRRVYARLHEGYNSFIKSGKIGRMAFPIRISVPETDVDGRRQRFHTIVGISGTDQEEAIMAAKASFGGMDVECYGNAWKAGEEATLLADNLKQLERCAKYITAYEEKIADMQKHIENVKFLQEQLEFMALQFAE